MKNYKAWLGHDGMQHYHATCKHAPVKRSTMKYTSTLALVVLLMALPHIDATVLTDDCDSCEVGKYAPVLGSVTCSACGAGTYGSNSGLSICFDCGAGIFPAETAYKGWCSVRKSTFTISNSMNTVTIYNGPGNTTWFDTTLQTISLRAILDTVKMDWAVGTQVRVGSALGQAGPLNPVVLRRIGISGQGLWSPANVNPMHTTNSTRYYMLL